MIPRCPKCGESYSESYDICPYCGAKKPSPKYCPECEFETYDKKYGFCPKCGTKLIDKSELDEINKLNEKIKICEKLGNYDDAIEIIDKSIEQNPSNEKFLFATSECLYKSSRYDESMEVLDKVIELEPNYSDAY